MGTQSNNYYTPCGRPAGGSDRTCHGESTGARTHMLEYIPTVGHPDSSRSVLLVACWRAYMFQIIFAAKESTSHQPSHTRVW